MLNKNSEYKSSLRMMGSRGRRKNNRNNYLICNDDKAEKDEDNGSNNKNIPMLRQILNTGIIIW